MKEKIKILIKSFLVILASFLQAAEEVSVVSIPHSVITDVLHECVSIKNMQPFKTEVVSKIGSFIDALQHENGTFLHESVVTGIKGKPDDHSRDAFKLSLAICLNSLTLTIPSADADLLVFKQQVKEDIIATLGKYMDNLLPVCTKMMHFSVKKELNKYTFVSELLGTIFD